MIDMKTAKILFHAGSLKDAGIIKSGDEWILGFDQKINNEWEVILYKSKRSKDVKKFKDLRSAVNITENIGFSKIEVITK